MDFSRIDRIELRSKSFDSVAARYSQPEQFGGQREKPFLLLLGPSGVGKSTIIREMVAKRPDRYTYIAPYTTRPLREGEPDKTHVDEATYIQMLNRGEFVFDNPLYGVRYGTPLEPIQTAFREGKIPLLDFPLKDIPELKLPRDITPIGVYCFPPTIAAWHERMNRDKRGSGSRLFAARELWHLLDARVTDQRISYGVVSREGAIEEAAEQIHDFVERITKPVR